MKPAFPTLLRRFWPLALLLTIIGVDAAGWRVLDPLRNPGQFQLGRVTAGRELRQAVTIDHPGRCRIHLTPIPSLAPEGRAEGTIHLTVIRAERGEEVLDHTWDLGHPHGRSSSFGWSLGDFPVSRGEVLEVLVRPGEEHPPDCPIQVTLEATPEDLLRPVNFVVFQVLPPLALLWIVVALLRHRFARS